jgi:hypothetical protein
MYKPNPVEYTAEPRTRCGTRHQSSAAYLEHRCGNGSGEVIHNGCGNRNEGCRSGADITTWSYSWAAASGPSSRKLT